MTEHHSMIILKKILGTFHDLCISTKDVSKVVHGLNLIRCLAGLTENLKVTQIGYHDEPCDV